VALCVIHNFIRFHEPLEPALDDEDGNGIHDPYETGTGEMAGGGRAAEEEPEQASERRDRIAEEMWNDYQRVCQERGIGHDNWLNEVSDDEYDSMMSV